MKRTLAVFALVAISLHAAPPRAGLARQGSINAGRTAAAEVADSHAVFRRMSRAAAPNPRRREGRRAVV